MSDSSSPQGIPSRRGAPTPLVFNPDTVLPVNLSASAANRGQTVNMPHVKRNITRRLKLAKQECDAALQKITNNITQYIEEQIRNKHVEDIQPQALREPFELQPADFSSAVASLRRQADDASFDDAGYEAELEGRHSRQPSVSSSPASLRRPSILPPARTPADTSPRRTPNMSMPPPTWATQPNTFVSRRLSRSIHVPAHSAPTSRSGSRSRSPLPSKTAHSSSATNDSLSTSTSTSPHPRDPDTLTQSVRSDRRSSRAFFDEPPAPDPFLTSLHELTAIATDICEASISTLTSQPKACHELVAKVRSIGNNWDEHPEWPGRSWHMQVLLALASLTRVVEWWEAENKFWNFSEEGDGTSENKDGEEEPFVFVFKPEVEDGEVIKTPAATVEQRKEQDAKALMVRDEFRTRLSPSKPSSLTGRRSRDEAHKDIAPFTGPQGTGERPSKIISDEMRVRAAEALREQADWARYTNIVLELGLDGDQVVSVNHAWRTVVGADPGELLENGISRFLHPDSWNVFKEATQELQADGGNTKEINFKLIVEPDTDDSDDGAGNGTTYCEIEGKGMLKGDKAVDGGPSHTIWVLTVVDPPRNEDVPSLELEVGNIGDDPGSAELLRSFNTRRTPGSEPITPFPLQQPINTALILCRICECRVPEWYFEKHSDSCSDVHRFEADIADCNETISELRSAVRELSTALDRASPVPVPDYRGMPIFSPSTSPGGASSPLQFRPQLSSRMQRASVRKLQQRLLEQLDDVLQVASEISAPSLKEEESAEPVERQRLLSPTSESKMDQVQNWNKPTTEDPALARLVQDVEKVMFGKVDNVLRMRDRIRYSEMSRRVWEASVEEQLARLDEEDEEGPGGSEEEAEDVQQQSQELLVPIRDVDRGSGSQSSTTSEYALGREAEPTPMASSIIVPSSIREPVAQTAFQGFGSAFGTRSSTPSSVSSPLALAVPITAAPPSFALSPETEGGMRAVRTRRSTQTLAVEPRVTLTPPLSPMASPREGGVHLRRHSTVHAMSPTSTSGPLSPRFPSIAPSSRTTPTSLKDFEVIKPISKGAFGSVFLAKKKATGDYYAIKVLKKADMITKNQVTNVKHERMILMRQAESPYVAKLYFTFQSKENLYLVMEYLNGGDCAALLKMVGSLPEEWTRNYVAEVILGLEYLHKRGIVHRDLKPDNLLIDSHGHLKLTDFGLSRIGLLNRQTRGGLHIDRPTGSSRSLQYSNSRPPSMDAAYLSSPLLFSAQLGVESYFNHRSHSHSAPHIAGNPNLPGPPPDDVSESSGSESLSGLFWKRSVKPGESPLQSFATDLTNDLRSHSGGTPPADQKFVGTPDYLAPESILGISGDDPTVDWWALGVITYEFLCGIPPFHADSPEKVFSNIISGHIEWHEEHVDYSNEARDFMAKLMVTDPSKRLGTNGADEVKAHPFLAAVEWDKVTTQEAQFIPQVTDPESTDYFDPRGAVPHLFQEDQEHVPHMTESPASDYLGSATTAPVAIVGRDAANSPSDDFGAFSFKNVQVLKQANDDVIRKLKTESGKSDIKSPLTSPGMQGLEAPTGISRRKSVSQRIKKLPTVITADKNVTPIPNPPSPSTSASSMASSPSRASQQAPLTPGSANQHLRRPSEYGAVERFKASHFEGDTRRNSMPSRLRTASISSTDPASDSSDPWTRPLPHLSGHFELQTPPSSLSSAVDKKPVGVHGDRAVTCLVAEDNPISQKILETVLTRMGCRCVLAADGAEAISVALGDIKFDCILMDLHMPVLDGEQAARYIKSTNNKNTSTPIIAVSAYSGQDAGTSASNIFAASLGKPIPKGELLAVMRQLGFKTTTQDGSKVATKLAR